MGWSGLAIAAAVLVAASGFGLFRHTRDGKVRMTHPAHMTRTARSTRSTRLTHMTRWVRMRRLTRWAHMTHITRWARLRRLTRRAHTARSAELDLSGLGVRSGRVTLLQFSSAFCAPCRATRVLCAQIAQENPHADHVEVDAASHLEAVRALNIWRTPTTLVVDAAGRIAGRAQGVPTLAQLRAAVQAVMLEAAK